MVRTNFPVLLRFMLLSFVLVAIVGCGSDLVDRHPLSGHITAQGKPVPYGWIIFTPEKGPGSTANIKDGRYETTKDFGHVGGMHTLEITAFGQPPAADGAAEGSSNDIWFRCTIERQLLPDLDVLDIDLTAEESEAGAGDSNP